MLLSNRATSYARHVDRELVSEFRVHSCASLMIAWAGWHRTSLPTNDSSSTWIVPVWISTSKLLPIWYDRPENKRITTVAEDSLYTWRISWTNGPRTTSKEVNYKPQRERERVTWRDKQSSINIKPTFIWIGDTPGSGRKMYAPEVWEALFGW